MMLLATALPVREAPGARALRFAVDWIVTVRSVTIAEQVEL
jgi:hypothetical protein